MHTIQILLASSSPRRREMISWLDIPFTMTRADIDESLRCSEFPLEYVQRLAKEKADEIGTQNETGTIVLAADTIVNLEEMVIGKPQNEAHARSILKELRNRTHQVTTAINLLCWDGKRFEDLCQSDVHMRDYSEEEIETYIASGDPMDKAGAYAIQNGEFNPVPEFHGCFASVMGFPFCHIERNLRKIDGYNWIPTDKICQKNLNYDCPIASRVLAGEDIG